MGLTLGLGFWLRGLHLGSFQLFDTELDVPEKLQAHDFLAVLELAHDEGHVVHLVLHFGKCLAEVSLSELNGLFLQRLQVHFGDEFHRLGTGVPLSCRRLGDSLETVGQLVEVEAFARLRHDDSRFEMWLNAGNAWALHMDATDGSGIDSRHVHGPVWRRSSMVFPHVWCVACSRSIELVPDL